MFTLIVLRFLSTMHVTMEDMLSFCITIQHTVYTYQLVIILVPGKHGTSGMSALPRNSGMEHLNNLVLF